MGKCDNPADPANGFIAIVVNNVIKNLQRIYLFNT